MCGDHTAQMGSHARSTNNDLHSIFFSICCKLCGFFGSAVGRKDSAGEGDSEFLQNVKCSADNIKIALAAHNNCNTHNINSMIIQVSTAAKRSGMEACLLL